MSDTDETNSASTNNTDAASAQTQADETIPANAQTEAEEIPAELLERAAQLGIDEALARKAGAKSIERIIGRAEQESETAAVEAASKVAPKQETKIDKLDLKLNPAEWSDEGRHVLSTLITEIEALKKSNAELQSKVETDLKSGRQSRIDAALDAAKDYESVVNGRPKNRAKVIEQVSIMEAGYKALGKTPPSDSQLVTAALATVFPNHTKKNSSGKAATASNGAQVFRPSQRNGHTEQQPSAMDAINKRMELVRSRPNAEG